MKNSKQHYHYHGRNAMNRTNHDVSTLYRQLGSAITDDHAVSGYWLGYDTIDRNAPHTTTPPSGRPDDGHKSHLHSMCYFVSNDDDATTLPAWTVN
jgi:hypothetical protein